MVRSIAMGMLVGLLAGCGGEQEYGYVPEVNYRSGDSQITWAGNRMSSPEHCSAVAKAYFDKMNRENEYRPYSWACRKMLGTKIVERLQ